MSTERIPDSIPILESRGCTFYCEVLPYSSLLFEPELTLVIGLASLCGCVNGCLHLASVAGPRAWHRETREY